MNYYQSGFLAGLEKASKNINPLAALVSDFVAGEKAKLEKTALSVSTWCDMPLSFKEGFKSSTVPHLAAKGKMLKEGQSQWLLGYTSGLNKASKLLDESVHNVEFRIEVEVNAVTQDRYPSFTQSYTYIDHQNEVYRIEARHRHKITSVYPNEHIIKRTPYLSSGANLAKLESSLGQSVILTTHDILQNSFRGYQPKTIIGDNFVVKAYQQYIKIALNIPQWNDEAKGQVTWSLSPPVFT